ncbi:MAG: hypothetical protein ABJA67_13600 [Chthonomonadales bacterium]
MLLRPFVTVPRSGWQEIRRALDLDTEILSRIASYIADGAVVANDVEELASTCAIATNTDEGDVAAVLALAINLKRIERNFKSVPLSEQTILSTFDDSMKQSDFPLWDKKYSELFRLRIPQFGILLAPDNVIDIMSKARELLYDYERIFIDCKVLTDVRYVYNNSGNEIAGGLIVHTIVMEYHENNKVQQMHLSLTEADILQVQGLLTRELKKSTEALETLAKSNIPDLTPKRNS